MRAVTNLALRRLTDHGLASSVTRSWPSRLVPSFHSVQLRSVTNAVKPDYIASLTAVPRVVAKPGGRHPSLVHSSGEVKFTVIRLQTSGGEVPAHMHSHVWDYFVPLSGEAVIEVRTKDGRRQDFDMEPGAFLAVPPEDAHRVVNRSAQEEFVFLIAQSPRGKYDFVPGDVALIVSME